MYHSPHYISNMSSEFEEEGVGGFRKVNRKFLIKLTHLPMLDKMIAISQAVSSNAFSWMKSFVFWFEFSLNFVPKDPTDNLAALVQVMACDERRQANQRSTISLTHICGTRGRWVNSYRPRLRDWQCDDISYWPILLLLKLPSAPRYLLLSWKLGSTFNHWTKQSHAIWH